jgi:hypothetical protein
LWYFWSEMVYFWLRDSYISTKSFISFSAGLNSWIRDVRRTFSDGSKHKKTGWVVLFLFGLCECPEAKNVIRRRATSEWFIRKGKRRKCDYILLL